MHISHLQRCLGEITTTQFKRQYLRQNLESLEHEPKARFDLRPAAQRAEEDDHGSTITQLAVAHKAGTNCIAIDQTLGRYMVSGGADTSVKLWDLETGVLEGDSTVHSPLSKLSKATPNAHSHSITSLSIYPFDPTPTTLLTTSYDQSLLLTQIASSSLQPLHKFPLDFTAYCHSISPISTSPLVAVGTSHPAPRLIDLRTALATHSLPGHTSSIYSLAWHPTKEHVLVSSSADGRILAFDIRRASPAFASFDMDDSLGVLESPNRPTLNYTSRAHSDAITGIIFSHDGSKLISAAQDQRIRVWDVATGRNDLVHFGPRIRNSRDGEFKPVLAPAGTSGMSQAQELLFWPNDDGRGEVFMHEYREGTMLRVLKTKQVVQAVAQPKGGKGRGRLDPRSVNRLTSGGRINGLAFRPIYSEEGFGKAVEMYSAHGDGRICTWMPRVNERQDEDEQDQAEKEVGSDGEEVPSRPKTEEEIAAERSRKRKRDLIDGLVEGLTKRPITFS